MAEPNLEPDTFGDTDAEHVQCSIAVSLKRIADALDDKEITRLHKLIDDQALELFKLRAAVRSAVAD